MRLPERSDPLYMPAVMFNKLLKGETFLVDRYKYSHDRIRSMVKRYTKAGYLTVKHDGRFLRYSVNPNQKFEFIKFLSEKNFHVKKYIKPSLLHLPESAQ